MIEIVIPQRPVRSAGRPTPAPVRVVGPVRVLGLLDNSKPGARDVLVATARQMVAHSAADRYSVVRKASSGRPMTSDDETGLLRDADVVITGVSDCGACTASTVYDAIRVVRAGLPCLTVVTSAFEGLARSIANTLGVPDLDLVVVDHPLQGITPEGVARAADAAEQILMIALARS
jgi:hypothetical protein